MSRADISQASKSEAGKKLAPNVNWETSKHNTKDLAKMYKKQLDNSKDEVKAIVKFHNDKENLVILCNCKEGRCHRMFLAEYLHNKFDLTYGGEIGDSDDKILQNLDSFEFDSNIESAVFDKTIISEAKARDALEMIWKDSQGKTIQDCLNEYEATNDQYKQSLDIPTASALIDMACMDKGYLEVKTEAIRSSRVKCCKDVEGNKVANNAAGRLDQMCFTELCVAHKGRLYRLEERSGKEIPKHRDIQWLQANIKCTLNEADQFNKAFIALDLGSKEVHKLIFGGTIEGKEKSGIKETGNKHLQYFTTLAEEMAEFKLVDKFEPYEDDKLIDEFEENGFEIEEIEKNFLDEEERFDTNLYTAKRLSIDEESLSEEEIAEIKYGTYDQYKAIVAKYMEPQYKFKRKLPNGKSEFAIIGKKVDSTMIKSAVSMAWIYLKEAKAKFKAIHEAETERELQEMPDYMAEAIEEYQINPSRQNKYRITTCVYGGTWDGVKIPPANPVQKKICWKVIYG